MLMSNRTAIGVSYGETKWLESEHEKFETTAQVTIHIADKKCNSTCSLCQIIGVVLYSECVHLRTKPGFDIHGASIPMSIELPRQHDVER